MASTVLPIHREGRLIGGGVVAPTVTAMATLDLSAIEATIQNHNAVGVATRGHREAEVAIPDHRVVGEAMVVPSVDEVETRTAARRSSKRGTTAWPTRLYRASARRLPRYSTSVQQWSKRLLTT